MANLNISIPTTKLPDGNEIPLLGYGTGTAWFKKDASAPLDKNLVEAAKIAIKLGYTHLDGAEVYNTEPELGQAIKESGVAREKLFVTTKVMHNIDCITAAFDASLQKLGLDYVDLYLIHAPFFAGPTQDTRDAKKLQDAWAKVEEIHASGRAKSIGVSNFLRKDLEAILKTAKVRPAINQIEYHPYLQHGDLYAFHKSQDIRVAAYGPQIPIVKGKGGPLDPLLDQLAKKYAVSPGEILLRWGIEQGIIVVSTSSKEQRLSDYLRVATFTLNPKEVEDITNVGAQHHFRGFWSDKFAPDDRT